MGWLGRAVKWAGNALGGGVLGGLIDTGFNIEKTMYDRRMQNKAWEREDTSVQRRVEDLKAAGLSPTLAAGSGAAASSPIATNLSQPGESMQARKQGYLDMMRQKEDISRTRAETDAAETIARKAKLEMDPLLTLMTSGLKIAENGDASESGVPIKEWLAHNLISKELASRKEAEARAREAEYRANLVGTQAEEASYNYRLGSRYGTRTNYMTGLNKLLNVADFAQGPVGDALREMLSDRMRETARQRNKVPYR